MIVALPQMTATAYVVLGGALAALYLLPTMSTPRWRWENIWAAGSLIALVVVPWPLALATVPDLLGVYRSSGAAVIVMVLCFGAAWGIGGIFWGRSVAFLGMSLGLSILIGVVNIFGSPVPLAIRDPRRLVSPGGLWMLLAIGVLCIGVTLCGLAGRRRNIDLHISVQNPDGKQVSFAKAALFCVLAGSLSAMNNFGPIFGERIVQAAAMRGASSVGKWNAMWAPLLTTNYMVNGGYALCLMKRRRTFRTLVQNSSITYWLMALFMGTAWGMCLVFYGIGIDKMGPYGAYTGYPIFLGSMIVTGNLAGLIRGEWSGTSYQSRRMLAVGIIVLVIAFSMLGFANRRLG
jgi:L-rhamnose-H+ transport protein